MVEPAMLPNFLIIGAQKCGTSALYQYLQQHPDVYMSPVKEPAFFAFENQTPDFRYVDGRPAHVNAAVTRLADYEALFAARTNERAVGEASTHYLYVPEAAGRIRTRVPAARLIAVLRDPVERAFSAYQHAVRDNHEPLRDFEAAVDAESERAKTAGAFIYRYRDTGLYHQQLRRYYDRFAADQIRVYLHEDMEAGLPAMLRDIFGFLDIDAGFVPDTATRYNQSGLPRSRLVHALGSHNPVVRGTRRLAKRLLPRALATRLKDARTRNLSRTQIDPEVRARLLPFFRDDILRLQDLLGRDLSRWLAS
jgi:hypothetical protein